MVAVAPPAAADLVFATWNVNGGEQEPRELRRHAMAMETETGEIDVLVLQEVIAEEQVNPSLRGSRPLDPDLKQHVPSRGFKL